MADNKKLCIIDSLSPFCIKKKFKSHINWSKVNYHLLEYEGKVRKKIIKIIEKQFLNFIKSISTIGYNAISIDDLAHITNYNFYPDSFKNKIKTYQYLIKNLILISMNYSIKVFINTDVMFYNKFIRKIAKRNFKKSVSLLYEACEKAFKKYPDVSGIIFRIGESDGIDVKGDFKSTIILKTTGQVKYLSSILPLFEKYNKNLIFRTWVTGGYKTGDLNWNKKTFLKIFKNIKSGSLIISMKYGEGDFFKYTDISENFFVSDHHKILELQTRREYEGFGEFPNFIGWEYHRIINQLKKADNLKGISVWCQTGGWSSFKNFTYQKNTSFFNELNTYITIKIFNESLSVNQALIEFLNHYKLTIDKALFVMFLRKTDFVINNLLYDPLYIKLKLYFNKLRIPPLLHIFWDNVTITNNVLLFYKTFINNPDISLKRGKKALNMIDEINIINKKLKIPYNHNLFYETFKLFYLIRKFIYKFNNTNSQKRLRQIKNRIKQYQKKFKNKYKFYIHLPAIRHFKLSQFILKLLIRRKSKYRFIDKLLFNPFTKIILLMFYKSIKRICRSL